MSIPHEAGQRCLFLVRKHPDMDDEELRNVCASELKAGFKFLPDHWIRDIVNYYVNNRRKLERAS